MGKVYQNLISTTAGFNYVAQQPLDDREVVQSYADLALLVSSNSSYGGMRVYVVDDKKSYELIGGVWHGIATEAYVTNAVESACALLDFDYDKIFAFDVEEIVVDFSKTTSKLGTAMLGQMILGKA